MRILVVEDDPAIAGSIAEGLGNEGFAVAVAATGTHGAHRLEKETFDLVVLDWMLPGRDGIAVVADLRARGSRTPVLLLTARDAVEDRVLGLESGADDYLVKPFAFAELLARIRALLRRSLPDETNVLRLDDLVVDTDSRRAARAGRDLNLTLREYDLLVYLLRHSPQVVTRRMLVADVWREPKRATPLDNVIDVHMGHLRKKVDDGHPRRLIHTLRGVGYVARILDDEEADAADKPGKR